MSPVGQGGNRPRGWIGTGVFLRLSAMGNSAKTSAREEIRRRLSGVSAEGRREASGHGGPGTEEKSRFGAWCWGARNGGTQMARWWSDGE